MSANSSREIIFGRQPAVEALRAGRRAVHRLFVAQNVRREETIDAALKLAQERRLPVQSVAAPYLATITHGGNHQGIALETGPYPYADFDDLQTAEDEPPFYLLLDHIQDPQNMGAIIRSAEAAGVHSVIIPRDRATGITPAVVRASAGATEHAAICQVVNIVETMRRLKEREIWLAGLEMTADAKIYTEADLAGPLGLVVGGEGAGLSRLARETCDFTIRLPMRGKVASLNASAAAAVALYEIVRQRAAAASR